jgi:hypothetical protein
MELPRKAGIAIVFGVPAIVGAGLTWHLAESWQAVFAYLGLLGFIVLAFLVNPEPPMSSTNNTV